MKVITLPNTTGGFTAAVEFHDGRLLVQFPIFRTADAAEAWGRAWIREAVAAHARALAAAGQHIRAVEG
jgi:hypothetical protein